MSTLKTTYVAPNREEKSPLPQGWTEHKAPNGHTYYYNASLTKSTYQRPVEYNDSAQHSTTQVATGYLDGWSNYGYPVDRVQPEAQSNWKIPVNQPFLGNNGLNGPSHGRAGQFRGGKEYQKRPKKDQLGDRPRSKASLQGHESWILVSTKLGRHFVYNSESKESFWNIPKELESAVALAKKGQGVGSEDKSEPAAKKIVPEQKEKSAGPAEDEQSDEYEEVTEEEDESEPEEPDSKRQRIGHDDAGQPYEFNEDDFAFQLQAMGQGVPDDQELSNEEVPGEEDEEPQLSEEDCKELFKDLLNDYKISPFSTWEKVIEGGKIVEDDRYTVLPNMKSRKEVWDEWSKQRAHELKVERAKEEKKDPRVPYLAFLHDNASPKLYWPEFKRKYRKATELRDPKLSDKDREKLYREHISRLKLPETERKSDLSKLLKSIPLSLLNRKTTINSLPAKLLADVRFISLPPTTRGPLLEAYVSTLESAPAEEGDTEAAEDEKRKQHEDRERREKAMADRARFVAWEKQRQQNALEFGRDRLKREEAELSRAMKFGREGLRANLEQDKRADSEQAKE